MTQEQQINQIKKQINKMIRQNMYQKTTPENLIQQLYHLLYELYKVNPDKCVNQKYHAKIQKFESTHSYYF